MNRRGAIKTIGAVAAPLLAETKEHGMELGPFCMSLTVKDLDASRKFYEQLGFKVRGGERPKKYLVMRNGDTVIGLFQDMFEKNILTFNPGWDRDAQKLAKFTDVRELQNELKASGVKIAREADPKTTGPEYIVVMDPDGNQILIDQHV